MRLRPVPVLVALVAVSAVLVGASGCAEPPGGTPAEPGQRPRTDGPDPVEERDSDPVQLRAGSGLLLGTPVYDGDFADPYVLRVGDTFYAYATNTKDANLPVIRFRAGESGRYHGDAFPSLPAWSDPGFVWAPAVYAQGERYVLYYTTRVAGTTMQCISRATSDSPLGPFRDRSTEPMVCQRDLGGTIDPSIVEVPAGRADAGTWLLFKNDGNCCGLPTSIWSARLSADGLAVEGEHHRLLTADEDWEGGLIEGPSMVLSGGDLYLFYSANAWDSDRYAIGWARCRSVTGPCERTRREAWMDSTPFARGPGGQEFFGAADRVWMVYAAWLPGQVGRPGGERRLYLDIVEWHAGEPHRVGSRTVSLLLLGLVLVAAAVVAGGAWFIRRRRRRRAPRPAG